MNSIKIKVGISSCLLGQEVRFNGGHKHSRLCTDDLSEHFSFAPVCPEVGVGLGVPRKPIRLVGDLKMPRAVDVNNVEQDITDQLVSYAKDTLPLIKNMSGYIFMKGSPSCGLFRVKVYDENGVSNQSLGRGIYARVVTDNFPLLPVEEAGRLEDPILKENFITRVYAYDNWRKLNGESLTLKKIIEFHSRYKYVLMAQHLSSYTELGKLLASSGKYSPEALAKEYFPQLMKALNNHATRKTHTNVLMHLQGYLKNNLNKKEKAYLLETIEQYRKGVLPLIAPIILLKNHFNQHPNNYIEKQAYMQPYPDNMSLRNHI